MKYLFPLIAAGLVALAVSPARGETKAETVLGGLSNPTGLAIQPETGHVFVSDSTAGKVIRVVDGKAEDVVVGFPKDVYGKGPFYDIGPLGLAFLDKDTLIIGDGSYKDGEEFVRVFTVPAAGKPALNFDKDAKAKLGPLPDKDGLKAEGNFYAIAVGKTAIYITSNGDDTKGWVLKADVNGTKFGELTRYIATKDEVDAPVGITMSSDGDIVIGQMGEVNKPKDSLLTFYSAKTGKKLLNLETGLYDITSLAYSPKKQLMLSTSPGCPPRTAASTGSIRATRTASKESSRPKSWPSKSQPPWPSARTANCTSPSSARRRTARTPRRKAPC